MEETSRYGFCWSKKFADVLDKYILLVGGLSESVHLQKRLIDLFGSRSTNVITVEEQTYVPLYPPVYILIHFTLGKRLLRE